MPDEPSSSTCRQQSPAPQHLPPADTSTTALAASKHKPAALASSPYTPDLPTSQAPALAIRQQLPPVDTNTPTLATRQHQPADTSTPALATRQHRQQTTTPQHQPAALASTS